MQVMVYREGIAMIASERFDLSNCSSLVHVTNSRVHYANHVGTPPANWLIQARLRHYVDEMYGKGHFDALWSKIKSVIAGSIWAVINKCRPVNEKLCISNTRPANA